FGPFISDHIYFVSGSQRKRRRRQEHSRALHSTEQDWRWRAVPVVCMFMIMLLLLGGRLWQLQIVQGDQGREASRNNSLSLEVIPAPRGIIYDKHGQILARNNPSFRVAVTYAELPIEESARSKVIERLENLL